jgi:RNA polymerase sigma-70 factor (ECF subfamily)
VEPTDDELLEAWRAGDEAAAEALMRRHFAAIYRFFRHKLPEEVEEATQRTFLGCVESAPRFRGDSSFRGFLFAIARKQLMLALRKKRLSLHEVDAGSVASPTGVIAQREDEQLLLGALRRLPVDFQITVELFYWEELPIADIAVVLDIAEGTVKSRLGRARAMLKLQIEALAASPGVAQTTMRGFEDWARRLHGEGPDGSDVE